MAAIQPKGGSGQNPLLFAGECHRASVAENPVLRPWPIHPFLQMLEWIPSFEPRIEHSVSKQHIRCFRTAQNAPGCETVKLPKPMHDKRVVSAPVDLQPRH